MKQQDLQVLWKTTLAQIEVKLDSPPHFKTWFIPTELMNITGKRAVVGVKNSYMSDWLRKKYLDLIQKTLSYVAGEELEVDFEIAKNLVNELSPKIESKDIARAPLLNTHKGENLNQTQIATEANINPKFSITNFVVGPSNRLAHASCCAVIEKPGMAYNPLFIYGKTGLGKTHLAQAIGIKLLEKNPGKKVLYKPSENFLNEMVSSIQTGKARDFRNRYRQLDLLIIDDIQMIYKWEQTQDELFNTFNALHNQNKQLVFVSDRPPEEIKGLEVRLLSRFQGGMVVQIEAPDFETRMAIVEKKAQQLNMDLPHELLEYIARHITDNVRRLEGSLQQLALYDQIHQTHLSIDEAANILGLDPQSKRIKIKPKELISIISKEFDVPKNQILGQTRKAEIALARQVAMFIMREDFGYKLEEIAEMLKRKDHTTIMHGIDKIKGMLELNKGFEEQIMRIREGFNVSLGV